MFTQLIVDKIRTDESRTARYNNLHNLCSFFSFPEVYSTLRVFPFSLHSFDLQTKNICAILFLGGMKMKPKERMYIAIDLGHSITSVRCMERGLNPLTTYLVVTR